MSNEKPGKFTLVATHEKFRRDKTFVQVEGELTEAQLAAIADGLTKLISLYTRLKEELMANQKGEKLTASATGELTKAQLGAIVAGGLPLN